MKNYEWVPSNCSNDGTSWSLFIAGGSTVSNYSNPGYIGLVCIYGIYANSYLPGLSDEHSHASLREAAKRIEAVSKEKDRTDQLTARSVLPSPAVNAPKAPSK